MQNYFPKAFFYFYDYVLDFFYIFEERLIEVDFGLIINLQMGKAEVILFATILLTGAMGIVVREESEGRTVDRRNIAKTTEYLECNASQYESVGIGALKRQDPFNKTFNSIQEHIQEYGTV